MTASAFLILVITALAPPELAAQAWNPAKPNEAMRTPSGQPWRGTLQSGAEVWVDPRTNRPMTRGAGYQTQLWDGVHRLSDGTELHVRNGRVVPTTEMLERRHATPTPPTPEAQADESRLPGGRSKTGQPAATASAQRSGGHPCQALIDQTCGRDNACAETTKCSAARQLLDMAAEERARHANPQVLTDTGLKCREALHDSFFTPCQTNATGE
ncbi:hypothetical protein [Halochromatium salexigens]|nr:hypothetical protein [Halochromatium salexigens]